MSSRKVSAAQPGSRQPPGPKERICSKCYSNPLRDGSTRGKQNQFYSPCSRPGRTGASHRVANENAARDTDRANTHNPCGGNPILALDMYEHAYHIDFGANAKAYVDSFMRNIEWMAIGGPTKMHVYLCLR